MSKGYSPMIPAIPAKEWVICDGCQKETEALEQDVFFIENIPKGWSSLRRPTDTLHFCEACGATMSVNGINLNKIAEAVLGDEYFK